MLFIQVYVSATKYKILLKEKTVFKCDKGKHLSELLTEPLCLMWMKPSKEFRDSFFPNLFISFKGRNFIIIIIIRVVKFIATNIGLETEIRWGNIT